MMHKCYAEQLRETAEDLAQAKLRGEPEEAPTPRDFGPADPDELVRGMGDHFGSVNRTVLAQNKRTVTLSAPDLVQSGDGESTLA